MTKRTTFLDEPVTDKNIRHLRIVISEPNDDNEYLTVSVDTYKSKLQDSSCLIHKGEHSFIKDTSFVNYKYAKVVSFQVMFNGIKKGLFIPKEEVSEQLLQRIQNGAKLTKFLDNAYKIWFDLF